MIKKGLTDVGITLIALVVTIIVLLILAGITISLVLSENGIINKSKEAKKIQAIAAKKEEVAMAIADEFTKNGADKTKVTVSNVVNNIKNNYSKQNEKDSIEGESAGDSEDRFPGTITYNPPSSTIDESIYVEVNEDLEVVDAGANKGVKAQKSTYEKKGKIYYNSPDLSGFNPRCTYYVTYDNNGNATNAGRIDQVEAPSEWYDYENKLWANIVTINNGDTTYWTWIPRFKYKTASDDSSIPAKTSDVKFVGDYNNKEDACYMEQDGQDIEINVESYKLSEAFEFGGKRLKGYWASKYRIQEGGNDGSGDKTTANIEVDASGFNPEVTRYVTYDNNGNASEGNKIQLGQNGELTNVPNGWYDYKNKKWANLVTENNGNKTYWTYIPRYKYKNWKGLNINELKFINKDQDAKNGYILPKAFEFNDTPLAGYWVSKYRVQEGINNGSAETSLENIEIDLSGFNPSVTKYVLYDDNGNETIGDNIIVRNGKATNMPNGWYDYQNKKWANIVTENGGKKTYWTYIPRYEYRIWSGLNKMETKFRKSTDSLTPGYKTPEAFNFANHTLNGYWVSKYRVQE